MLPRPKHSLCASRMARFDRSPSAGRPRRFLSLAIIPSRFTATPPERCGSAPYRGYSNSPRESLSIKLARSKSTSPLPPSRMITGGVCGLVAEFLASHDSTHETAGSPATQNRTGSSTTTPQRFSGTKKAIFGSAPPTGSTALIGKTWTTLPTGISPRFGRSPMGQRTG